jgi:hypothetical protein
MKLLSTDQALALLPADDQSVEIGLSAMDGLNASNVDQGQLRELVRTGKLNANIETRDGKPFAVIFWQADEGTRTLTAAAANIEPGKNFEDIMTALEHIARLTHCRWVQFQTRRPGVARMATTCGWTVDTVVCLKKVA